MRVSLLQGRRGGAARGRLVGLLLLGGLAACAAPAPPAPGTPGINLSTPLPYTPVALAPTATTLPPTAPSLAASPTAAAQQTVPPTANTALPQMVLMNRAGTPVRLYVELALTPDEQETGLMHRPALPEDQGMLFVFPGETTIPFWMENTLIPLSIAFIAGDRTIVDIQDMQALDETLHTPAHPYVYALEVNQGYFVRHDIAVGNTVQLPPLPTPTALDGSP